MNKSMSLVISALAITAISVSNVTASAKTRPANTDTELVGNLQYKKVATSAHFTNNYSKLKLYNHIPTSNYKHIKTIPWKRSGLNLKQITTISVKINMMACQGTRYNWYRFLISKKSGHKTVKVNYWVYGQSLKLK